jgi:hypothetical protein
MFSKPLIVVLVVLAICGVLRLILSARSHRKIGQYVRADLFNASEHAFLFRLPREAPAHIAVLAKIRVADLIKPARRDIVAFNRIAMKHVDFALYHLQTRQVLMAIELDGPTHASERSRASDRLKDEGSASAGVRLVRVPVSESEKVETVCDLFRETQPTDSPRSGISAAPKENPSSKLAIASRQSTGTE